MARIPYVDPSTAPEHVRKVFEALPVELNVFKLMAHAESNFRPLMRLGGSILTKQKLDAKLRELAILRVAKLSRAEYEWIQHVPIARQAGASEAQIDALRRSDPEADCFDPLDRAVLRFTDELVKDVAVSQGAFSAAAEQLSHREIVELILAVGFYMMLARLMETAEIDLDPPAGTAVVEAAR